MATINVWLKDIKQQIEEWENEGIKALEIRIENFGEGEELMISGLESGGLGITVCEEPIKGLTFEELLENC